MPNPDQDSRSRRRERDSTLDDLQRLNARNFKRENEYRNRAFGNLMDNQMQMLQEYYSSTNKQQREALEQSIRGQQDRMEAELESMRKSFKQYGKYASAFDKQMYNAIYKDRLKDLKRLNRQLDGTFDGISDHLDEMSEQADTAFKDAIAQVQDMLNTLNINNLANSVENAGDSWNDVMREITQTVNLPKEQQKELRDIAAQVNKETGYTMSPGEMAQVIAEGANAGLRDSELTKYAASSLRYSAATDSSITNLIDVVWQDERMGAGGALVEHTGNLVAALGRSFQTNIGDLEETLNSGADTLAFIADGDNERYKALLTDRAVASAAAGDSATAILDKMLEWQSMTRQEFLSNTEDVQLLTSLGIDANAAYNQMMNAQSSELLGSVLQGFENLEQTRGKDFVASLATNAFGMNLGDLGNLSTSTYNESLPAVRMAAEAADMVEQANNVQKSIPERIGNWFSDLGPVRWLTNMTSELDISLANLANAAIVASNLKTMIPDFLKGGQKLLNKFPGFANFFRGGFSGGIRNMGSTLLGGLKGLGSTLLGGIQGLGGLITKGAGLVSKGVGAVAGGVSSALGSIGGAAGGALTGGAGLAGGAAVAAGASVVAGAAVAIRDAVVGFQKSTEWLGEENGNKVSGKVNSTLGAVLGGTGPGVMDEGTVGQKALNVAGGAVKGAAIGTLIFPGVGTAIGAAVGGVASAIGGSNIAKGFQNLWEGIKGGAASLWETTKQGAASLWENTKTGAANLFTNLQTGFGGLIGTLHDAFTALTDTVKETFTNSVEDVKENWEEAKTGYSGAKDRWNEGDYLGAAGSAISTTGKMVKDTVTDVASNVWEGITSLLPGHATGLDTVPWDNYMARLHKGEAVLNSGDASAWREGLVSTIQKLAQTVGQTPIGQAGKMIAGRIGEGISSAFPGLVEMLNESPVFSKITGIFGLNQSSLELTEDTQKEQKKALRSGGIISESGIVQTVKKKGFFSNLLSSLGLGGKDDDVSAFASGGVVTSPTLGLVGEAGAETVLPMKSFNNIVDLANNIISKREGHYDSINGNDNGSLSIGKIQWHAGRAKDLVKQIQSADASAVSNAISMHGAANLSAMISGSDNWGSYKLTKNTPDYKAMKDILASNASHMVQDRLIKNDISSYIEAAKSWGLQDSKALIFTADFQNQFGTYSNTVKNAVKKGLESGGTLDAVYQAAMESLTNQASRDRRTSVYQELKGMAVPAYKVGTPFMPGDQVMIAHEGEMIVPKKQNPFSSGEVVPIESEGRTGEVHVETDNQDVVDVIKWAVSRIEKKIDETARSQGTPRRNVADFARRESDTSKVFSF